MYCKAKCKFVFRRKTEKKMARVESFRKRKMKIPTQADRAAGRTGTAGPPARSSPPKAAGPWGGQAQMPRPAPRRGGLGAVGSRVWGFLQERGAQPRPGTARHSGAQPKGRREGPDLPASRGRRPRRGAAAQPRGGRAGGRAGR